MPFLEDRPMNFLSKFDFIWPSGFRRSKSEKFTFDDTDTKDGRKVMAIP